MRYKKRTIKEPYTKKDNDCINTTIFLNALKMLNMSFLCIYTIYICIKSNRCVRYVLEHTPIMGKIMRYISFIPQFITESITN